MSLALNAFIKYILGIFMISLLLFVPAGSINYFNAWLLLGLLFIPMFIFGIVLYIKNPELLKRRLNNKEKESTQKIVILISLILFIVSFIVCGLDYKYNWSNVSDIVVIISSIVLVLSYMMYIEVMRENSYLSRTIEVNENQKIIDSGLYAIVRHPMYLSVIFLFLSMPLVLGSWYGFLVFLIFPILIVVRIINEEKVMIRELVEYKEYKKKVKYRLIPFIW